MKEENELLLRQERFNKGGINWNPMTPRPTTPPPPMGIPFERPANDAGANGKAERRPKPWRRGIPR